MLKILSRAAAAVLLITMLYLGASCTPKQKVSDEDYVNLRIGNEWKYQISSLGETRSDSGQIIKHGDKPAVITYKVTGQEDVDGKKCVVRENMVGEKFNPREYYEVDPAVGVQLRKQGFRLMDPKIGKTQYIQVGFNPPQLMLKFPLTQGQNWTRKINRGNAFDTAMFVVKGVEKVETPAGKYDALKIESSGQSSQGGEFTAQQWYAPNVGLVKETVQAKTADGTVVSETILQEYKGNQEAAGKK
ncbi:MAG: hypothetical protein LWY06_13475 [Firmicutes bacterium]|nr:hypothetical protein [Bacillota bacterium]